MGLANLDQYMSILDMTTLFGVADSWGLGAGFWAFRSTMNVV